MINEYAYMDIKRKWMGFTQNNVCRVLAPSLHCLCYYISPKKKEYRYKQYIIKQNEQKLHNYQKIYEQPEKQTIQRNSQM